MEQYEEYKVVAYTSGPENAETFKVKGDGFTVDLHVGEKTRLWLDGVELTKSNVTAILYNLLGADVDMLRDDAVRHLATR